jgi:hypothetical protein
MDRAVRFVIALPLTPDLLSAIGLAITPLWLTAAT